MEKNLLNFELTLPFQTFLKQDPGKMFIEVTNIHKQFMITTYEVVLDLFDLNLQYKINKRYTEFAGLYDSLKERIQNITLPEFPSKFQVFNKLEGRKKFFDQLLKFILNVVITHQESKKELFKILYKFITLTTSEEGGKLYDTLEDSNFQSRKQTIDSKYSNVVSTNKKSSLISQLDNVNNIDAKSTNISITNNNINSSSLNSSDKASLLGEGETHTKPVLSNSGKGIESNSLLNNNSTAISNNISNVSNTNNTNKTQNLFDLGCINNNDIKGWNIEYDFLRKGLRPSFYEVLMKGFCKIEGKNLMILESIATNNFFIIMPLWRARYEFFSVQKGSTHIETYEDLDSLLQLLQSRQSKLKEFKMSEVFEDQRFFVKLNHDQDKSHVIISLQQTKTDLAQFMLFLEAIMSCSNHNLEEEEISKWKYISPIDETNYYSYGKVKIDIDDIIFAAPQDLNLFVRISLDPYQYRTKTIIGNSIFLYKQMFLVPIHNRFDSIKFEIFMETNVGFLYKKFNEEKIAEFKVKVPDIINCEFDNQGNKDIDIVDKEFDVVFRLLHKEKGKIHVYIPFKNIKLDEKFKKLFPQMSPINTENLPPTQKSRNQNSQISGNMSFNANQMPNTNTNINSNEKAKDAESLSLSNNTNSSFNLKSSHQESFISTTSNLPTGFIKNIDKLSVNSNDAISNNKTEKVITQENVNPQLKPPAMKHMSILSTNSVVSYLSSVSNSNQSTTTGMSNGSVNLNSMNLTAPLQTGLVMKFKLINLSSTSSATVKNKNKFVLEEQYLKNDEDFSMKLLLKRLKKVVSTLKHLSLFYKDIFRWAYPVYSLIMLIGFVCYFLFTDLNYLGSHLVFLFLFILCSYSNLYQKRVKPYLDTYINSKVNEFLYCNTEILNLDDLEDDECLNDTYLISEEKQKVGLMKQLISPFKYYKEYKEKYNKILFKFSKFVSFLEKIKNLFFWKDPVLSLHFTVVLLVAYLFIINFNLRYLLLFSIVKKFIVGREFYKNKYINNCEVSKIILENLYLEWVANKDNYKYLKKNIKFINSMKFLLSENDKSTEGTSNSLGNNNTITSANTTSNSNTTNNNNTVSSLENKDSNNNKNANNNSVSTTDSKTKKPRERSESDNNFAIMDDNDTLKPLNLNIYSLNLKQMSDDVEKIRTYIKDFFEHHLDAVINVDFLNNIASLKELKEYAEKSKSMLKIQKRSYIYKNTIKNNKLYKNDIDVEDILYYYILNVKSDLYYAKYYAKYED